MAFDYWNNSNWFNFSFTYTFQIIEKILRLFSIGKEEDISWEQMNLKNYQPQLFAHVSSHLSIIASLSASLKAAGFDHLAAF